MFPIRDLSAKTKVNTVTIRAWERRYGLLQPQRTEKGHRLYSESDVRRIEQILALISRGVPVSKVKALLDNESDATREEVEDSWAKPVENLIEAVQGFDADKVERLLGNVFISYPAALCGERLLQPVMAKLVEASGGSASYHFLQSEFVRFVYFKLASFNKQAGKDSALLICGEGTPIWKLALVGMMLGENKIAVQLLGQTYTCTDCLALACSSEATHRIIYQDGVWKSKDIEKVDAVLADNPAISFCGTAPMLAKDKLNTANVYATPEALIESLA